jgi:hypothetical protein
MYIEPRLYMQEPETLMGYPDCAAFCFLYKVRTHTAGRGDVGFFYHYVLSC